MEKGNQVKHYLPASLEFQAVFVNSNGSIIKKPVVCWVVNEAHKKQAAVIGMCEGEEGITCCDDTTFYDHSFVGYLGPGEDLLSIMPDVAEAIKDLEDEEDLLEGIDDLREKEFLQELMTEDQEYLKQDDFMKNLPMALSQLSVLVREQINGGYAPQEWEQWMDMMIKFGHLIDDSKIDKGE